MPYDHLKLKVESEKEDLDEETISWAKALLKRLKQKLSLMIEAGHNVALIPKNKVSKTFLQDSDDNDDPEHIQSKIIFF